MPTKPNKRLGRSLLRGEVSLSEVAKLTKAFESAHHLFDAETMEGSSYDVIVVDGDLKITGDFSTARHKLCGLVVNGDLRITGHYEDTDDPNTGVYVLGDMSAASVWTNGSLAVKGDLVVKGGLVGYYNECMAEIRGKTRALFLATEQHWFEFRGAVDVKHVLGPPRGSWPKRTKLIELATARYAELLVPEVFRPRSPKRRSSLSADDLADLDDCTELDHDELRKRLRSGKPILRPRSS
jgi:hypothetical protein